MLTCDKCGGEVSLHNDVLTFDAILMKMMERGIDYQETEFEERMTAFWLVCLPGRHLLPILGSDGAVLCVGSPSRAQYFEGQIRDTRDAFAYDQAKESLYRAAYQRLQEEECESLKS